MTTPLIQKDSSKEDAATQQIAREAAERLYHAGPKDADITLNTRIIRSAIERAIKEQREQINHTQRLIGLTKLSKAAQPQPDTLQDCLEHQKGGPAQPQPSKARKEQAPRAQGSPESGEWECPECKTRYVSNVGNCGNNLDCSRPNVVPVQRTEPRGQQQEWRAKNGCICFGERRWLVEYRQSAIEIVELIKAELAAEREKREKESKHLRDSLNHLQDSLSAERQISKEWFDRWGDTKAQLCPHWQR